MELKELLNDKSTEKFWKIYNQLRGKLHENEVFEIILTYLSARIIDKYKKDGLFKNKFLSLKDINNYLESKKFESLKYDERTTKLSEKIEKIFFKYIKENDLIELLDYFLFTPVSYPDFGHNLDTIFGDFEDLLNFDDCKKIADIDCKGSSLLLMVLSNYLTNE